MKFQIRKATEGDVDVICELVRELASYEKMSDQVTFTNEIFADSIFNKNHAKALVCESEGRATLSIFIHSLHFWGLAECILKTSTSKKSLEIKASARHFLNF